MPVYAKKIVRSSLQIENLASWNDGTWISLLYRDRQTRAGSIFFNELTEFSIDAFPHSLIFEDQS
ncbi:MAG TPA: hypothetical protein PKI70_00075 [Mesotoga sp.]|nr:hypothetical protein [Mesotoga sp.]